MCDPDAYTELRAVLIVKLGGQADQFVPLWRNSFRRERAAGSCFQFTDGVRQQVAQGHINLRPQTEEGQVTAQRFYTILAVMFPRRYRRLPRSLENCAPPVRFQYAPR